MDIRMGDPWPAYKLIKAADKTLDTVPGESPDQYVALWYVHGEPVMGRIWNNNGVVSLPFSFFFLISDLFSHRLLRRSDGGEKRSRTESVLSSCWLSFQTMCAASTTLGVPSRRRQSSTRARRNTSRCMWTVSKVSELNGKWSDHSYFQALFPLFR